MKKAIVFILLLLILSSLGAEVYTSNILGQKLDKKNKIENIGYEIEILGNLETLYLDGKIEKTIEERNGEKIITTEDKIEIYTFKDDLLKKITSQREDGESAIVYEYSPDGALKRVLYVENELIKKIDMYYNHPLGGLSSHYDVGYLEYFGEDNFMYTYDYKLHNINSSEENILIKSVYDKNGNNIAQELLLDKNNQKYVKDNYDTYYTASYYSDNANIQKIIYYDLEDKLIQSIYYEYDEEDRIKKEEIYGSEYIIKHYKDGILQAKDIYVEDVLYSSFTYFKDGKIQEIKYKNKKPYSRILYDIDGIRVLELELYD